MFSTGQFSKIAQVSKRLLHHYDEVGLFKPVDVDASTGSRYYHADQLPHLFQILALKELGIPLDEIRRMVRDGLSSESVHEILVVQKAQIRGRLEQEQLRLRAVESRLRSFEAAETTQSDLIVKPVPAQHALTVRRYFPTAPEAFHLIDRLVVETPKLVGKARGPVLAMNHCEGYEMEDIDGEIGILLKEPTGEEVTLSTGDVIEPTILPAVGAMVSSVRLMNIEDTQRSFAAIGIWLDRTGHRMAGPSREVFLEPPSPEGVAVIETQFPVEPIDK